MPEMGAQMVDFLGDILPELILAGGGIAVLLVALFTPRRVQPWVAVAAGAVAAAAGWFAVVDLSDPPGSTFFGTLNVDGLGRWATLLLTLVAIHTIALSVEWFESDARHGDFYFILLYGTLGAVLMAGATDLMEMVMAIVLSSVTGYALAAFHRRSRASSEAGMKYFLLGALTNAAMVYGVALFFGLGATTTFADLGTGIVDSDPLALSVAFGLVMMAIAFKIGAVPAHPWVPDVAEGAPAPAAAFIMIAGKIGALVLLARLVVLLPETQISWRPLVALVAALTMTVGNLIALRQDDVRRLLGWSAVSQAGYGLLAIVAVGRTDLAATSLVMFLFAYSFATLAVFGVVVELRGLTDRQAYAGLASSHPWLAGALLVGFLSFVGIPPLGGFAAKLLLMGAVIEAGYGWLAVLTAINSAISLVYYLRVLAPAYLQPSIRPVPLLGRHAAVAVATATAGTVAIGVFAQPLLHLWQTISLLGG
jgi:NADH-quinone oxidoreductase subunit N